MKRTDKLMAMGLVTAAAEKVLWAKRAAKGDVEAVAFFAKHGQTVDNLLSEVITGLANAVEIMARAK